MFILKCKISGYILQDMFFSAGKDGVKSKGSFTLSQEDAIHFKGEAQAKYMCELLNTWHKAKLPYDFEEGNHAVLEAVEV